MRNLYWEPKTLDIGPGLSDLLKIVELEEQKHSRKWDTNERSLVVIKTRHRFQSFYKQILPDDFNVNILGSQVMNSF